MEILEVILTCSLAAAIAFALMYFFLDYFFKPKTKLGKLEAENERLRNIVIERDLQMQYMQDARDLYADEALESLERS